MINTTVAETMLKAARAEDIFSPSPDETKRIYRQLMKTWHPDVCLLPEAQKVTDLVMKLYSEAQEKIAGGYWGYVGAIVSGGKKFPYFKSGDFELGQWMVGRDVFMMKLQNIVYAERYLEHILKFRRYANEKMKNEIEKSLPGSAMIMGNQIMGIPKNPDLIRLRDVINYYNGSLDPKAVAWIMSCLYNLCCYFEYSRVTHNDISPDTYFINPKDHSGALLGGWFYWQEEGKKIDRVNKRAYDLLPWSVKAKKKASILTDLELVKATGREMLGDIAGKKMR